MTRIQIARDVSMADTIVTAHQHDQRTVILLCGLQHAHQRQGVPAHLPTSLRCHSVRLTADGYEASEAYHTVWRTTATPEKDHCAELEKQLQKK
jgi:uncharacterized iron-regulated protein